MPSDGIGVGCETLSGPGFDDFRAMLDNSDDDCVSDSTPFMPADLPSMFFLLDVLPPQ